MKDFVLIPFDWIYQAVCGDLQCTYCCFYRGTVVGVAVSVCAAGLTVFWS